MKTKLTTLIALCFALCCLPVTAEEQQAEVQLTNRVQALLDAYAGADDLLDEKLLQKRAELEAMGEKTFPVLCTILAGTENPVYQARVIEVFLQVKGDSKVPLTAVRELLKTRRDTKYNVVHQAALKYLGEKGEVEDIPLLTDYTSASDLVTRKIALKSRDRIKSRVISHPTSSVKQGSSVTNTSENMKK